MATANAAYLPRHCDNVPWKLAAATVCDTQDVAQALPQPTSVLTLVRTGFHAILSIYQARNGFRRLVTRQGTLLTSLRSAKPENWSHKDCASMSQLLDELLYDERSLIDSALRSAKIATVFWEESLASLRAQAADLTDICHHIDALSVHESVMPGDDEYREYMFSLNAPDELDFSLDNDQRKMRTFA